MSSRPVLITGAAGFIGAALCRHLTAAGQHIVGFDNLSRGSRARLPPGVPLIVGDIRDGAAWNAAVRDVAPRAVVHLAAMHFIPDCIARPAETHDVNIEGTRRVLEGCRHDSVTHVVFASTAAVYAPSDVACVEDDTPLGPLEVYGESKLQGEGLVREWAETSGRVATTLRLFNAVGLDETNPHVVPHIFESLQKGDTIALGNIEPRRDYVDTRDIASAVDAVLATPTGYRVLNVGTGIAHSVADIVERLRQLLERPLTVEHVAARARATERMMLVADISRISSATGWRPRFTLDQSLSDLLRAYGLHAGTTSGG